MKIPILIEPIEGGYRARAGEPFAVSAEGPTEEEATRRIAGLLRDRLRSSRLAVVEIDNGQGGGPVPATPEDEWAWATFLEAVTENRRREDEAPE